MRTFKALLVSSCLVCAGNAQADYVEDIGYLALRNFLGSATPTGAGVLVSHVNASEGFLNGMPIWQPDTSDAAFTGKSFELLESGATLIAADPNRTTSHSTGSGRLFYGIDSIAPGIASIQAFEASHWFLEGFLNYGRSGQPGNSPNRVGSHSYVNDAGSTDQQSGDSEILRRLDWVIETDDATHVVAMNNGFEKRWLFSTGFNAIAVGRSDGIHDTGLPVADAPYNTARARPDIVAPLDTTSAATPVVAAAAALLVETGHNGGLALSNGYTSHGAGLADGIVTEAERIYNAERSETIKAALMAGADRETRNSTVINITDYNPDAANGLDRRYGAGQINIFNSYHILAGGEHDSSQDSSAAVSADRGNIGCAGSVLCAGFDYDDAFGGAQGSNATAEYFFTTEAGSNWLFTAALVWNVDVNGVSAGLFDGTVTLHNLNLELVDLSNPGNTFRSASLVDNTENLWRTLEGGHDYALRVLAADQDLTGVNVPFLWDYALAWKLSAVSAAPVPLPASLWLLGPVLPVVLLRGRRRTAPGAAL